MYFPKSADQEVRQRLADSAQTRAGTRLLMREGRGLDADTPERRALRRSIIVGDPAMAAQLPKRARDVPGTVRSPEGLPTVKRTLEVLIETNDMLPIWFLERATAARQAVARIKVRRGDRLLGWGTGFLVGERLLLTNQHVFETRFIAQDSWVEFDFVELSNGLMMTPTVFQPDPDNVFLTSPVEGGLDYALVALKDTVASGPGQLTNYRYLPLYSQTGKILLGEPINSIHHPEGQSQRLSIRENSLLALPGPWLHYETDTLGGSSGAPLFNDQWMVVGVHHRGVDRRDAEGRPLTRDGKVWNETMGDSTRAWIGNEGLRVSALMADLRAQLTKVSGTGLPDGQRLSDQGIRWLRELLDRDQPIA